MSPPEPIIIQPLEAELNTTQWATIDELDHLPAPSTCLYRIVAQDASKTCHVSAILFLIVMMIDNNHDFV